MIKKLILLSYSFFMLTNLFAQSNKEEESIFEEGKKLYKSEMASWLGTDVFLNKFIDKKNDVGGYFSYLENELSKCLFFTKGDSIQVIATIIFDSSYNVETAIIDDTERPFTKLENDFYTIRKIAYDEIQKDTMFKLFKNTNFNLVLLIDDSSKKVFVLTGPQKKNVVIFGNDYLLTFDEGNNLISKKQIHHNIIPIDYTEDEKVNSDDTLDSYHTHLHETGEPITSTDICTLLLYQKYARWRTHTVIGDKTMCIWTCGRNKFIVITKDIYNEIYKDHRRRLQGN